MIVYRMGKYAVNLLFSYIVGWSEVREDLSGKLFGHILEVLHMYTALGQAMWCPDKKGEI